MLKLHGDQIGKRRCPKIARTAKIASCFASIGQPVALSGNGWTSIHLTIRRETPAKQRRLPGNRRRPDWHPNGTMSALYCRGQVVVGSGFRFRPNWVAAVDRHGESSATVVTYTPFIPVPVVRTCFLSFPCVLNGLVLATGPLQPLQSREPAAPWQEFRVQAAFALRSLEPFYDD
jgi:hypothetical protein